MSNSPLICYTKISPNRNSPRNHKIDTITIHCMAGQLSVETCGNVFAPKSRQASSNYGVDYDGRIGMYVEEKDRSWCSSNAANDNRAITIEVASDSKPPYKVTQKAYEATIRLCVDICQRNGIKQLVWSTDKNTRVNHLNGANMTVHRDYSSKSCPGDYLYERMGQIASAVNARLGGNMTYVGKGIATGSAKEDMAVRDAASTKGVKIGIVKKGEKVEILSVLANNWLKIVWPGSPKGYAYTSNAGGGYYDIIGEPSKKPKYVGYVNTGLLNVRTDPFVSNPPTENVITQLGYKNMVDVCDQSGNWLYIRFKWNGVQNYGWVASNYITKV